MANIDVPQPAEPIDHTAPGDIVEHRALAVVDEQRRLVIIRVMQRMNQVLAVGFEQLRRAVHGMLLALL